MRMKTKTIGCLTLFFIFFAFFSIPVILQLSKYYRWMRDSGLSVGNDPASYDIRGTITDTSGNPLNDVYLDMTYEVWGTTLPVIHSRRKVDSDFHINGRETHFLELKFYKKGYYSSFYSFKIDHTPLQEELTIEMAPSKQMGISDFLTFSFEKKQKIICDLSDLDHGIIQAQTVDLETNPGTKHLEFDFRRDENGDIVFSEPQSSYSNPMPTAFIIRLHSDDQDDGLIATSGSNVAKITAESAGRLLSGEPSEENDDRISPWTIPATGYGKKEIVIESPSRDMDAAFFLKCGGRFGKGELSIPDYSTLGFRRNEAAFKFELDINKEKGDRNLHRELHDDFIPRIYY